MAGEVVISGNTQGLSTPSPISPRLDSNSERGDVVKFRTDSKSVISKPRIKRKTFGIYISFGSGKDEFEAAAYFVMDLLPWGVLGAR